MSPLYPRAYADHPEYSVPAAHAAKRQVKNPERPHRRHRSIHQLSACASHTSLEWQTPALTVGNRCVRSSHQDQSPKTAAPVALAAGCCGNRRPKRATLGRDQSTPESLSVGQCLSPCTRQVFACARQQRIDPRGSSMNFPAARPLLRAWLPQRSPERCRQSSKAQLFRTAVVSFRAHGVFGACSANATNTGSIGKFHRYRAIPRPLLGV